MTFGLTIKELCEIVYDFARLNGKRIPTAWVNDKAAGNAGPGDSGSEINKLCLQKPENTSIARTSFFNPANVKTFHDV